MSVDSLINKIKELIIRQNEYQNRSSFSDYLKLDENVSTDYETTFDRTLELNFTIQFENWTSQYYMHFENRPSQWKIMVIFFYSLVVFGSFFGNSIVCKIVFWNSAMRSTTNIFIGNLSFSDLLMTVVNIPLQLIQILSRNWPLSNFLCRCLPFFQALSVNVSSFTMACIALDRYQVTAHPLKPRPGMTSIVLKIIFIWIMAILASSPYPAIADVENDLTYDKVTRCRLIYPEPQYEVRQSFTIIVMTVQFLAPLSITGIAYFKICCIIWRRKSIGVVSASQTHQRHMAKWKTIKMLIIVFLVFVICWLPLNIYHIYQDFRGTVGPNKHNPAIYLVCHWFAMSSICYNPFLYCWLNDGFRVAAKSYLGFFLRISPKRTTMSFNFWKNRRTHICKNKLSGKISQSLNSPRSSHAAVLAQHHSEKMDPVDFRRSLNKRNSPNKLKLKMSYMLNFMKRNESKRDKNLELETANFFEETREIVI